MSTVIVIPTYDEAESLPVLVRRIQVALPGADLLIMDDNSPDGTADVAERLFASRPEFERHRVVRREGPRGLGRAYCDGFARALASGYDTILQMDADLSHDPKYLPDLLAAGKSADLVIGSRYCPGGGVRSWPMRRVLLSRFAGAYVRTIAGIRIADPTGGFRCWTRHALESVDVPTLQSEGYSFIVEMAFRAARAGLRVVEIPIVFTDRRYGQSKMSTRVMIESIRMPWRLRRSGFVPQPRADGPPATEAASGRTAPLSPDRHRSPETGTGRLD
jgi:dolichol-phosphate mannosyltransferase